MKKNYRAHLFFLLIAVSNSFLLADSIFSYPRVNVENTTPYYVHIEARYPGGAFCQEDRWDGNPGILMPDGTVFPTNSEPNTGRGGCLLTELWAYVYVERKIFDIDEKTFYIQKIRVETEHYTSSGTSYSQFRIRAIPIPGWTGMPVDTRGPLPFKYIMERR